MECLQRPYSIKPCDLDVPALGFDLPQDSVCSGHVCRYHFGIFVSRSVDIFSKEGDQASGPGKRKRGGDEEGTQARPYRHRRLEKPIWHELKLRCAQPCKAIRGHTGYLLFATLNPKCM